MGSAEGDPRILLISQWPNIKNAEYELIEKIRHTPYQFTVVDNLGFDVDSGQCINMATLAEEYDFAIAFHYDTSNFLNLPTFFWVANPLEFMHLGANYRDIVFHQCRSFDEYLYNASSVLIDHIQDILGSEKSSQRLMFYSSSANAANLPPVSLQENPRLKPKIFYCGINWERLSDNTGRAQGILELLENKKLAEFYGPKSMNGQEPWKDFKSYQGEIPFDGISLVKVMREYTAVLALSSPAHLKSQTSSNRVFEGFAAGLPVISDENPHVKLLFGDLVYYFSGDTDEEKLLSIEKILEHIRTHPEQATVKVIEAQKLIAKEYSFDVTLKKIFEYVKTSRQIQTYPKFLQDCSDESSEVFLYDLCLFYHDPYSSNSSEKANFENLSHLIQAAKYAVQRFGGNARILVYDPFKSIDMTKVVLPKNVLLIFLDLGMSGLQWSKLRFGEKLHFIKPYLKAEMVSFLTQADYPHYDFCVNALKWYDEQCVKPDFNKQAVHVSGFFVNDLKVKLLDQTKTVFKCNMSRTMYQWTQKSFSEHTLGAFSFSRAAINALNFEVLRRFDAIFSVAILLQVIAKEMTWKRGRLYAIRVAFNYFERHYEAYVKACQRGFWMQHYELLANYTHEMNKLYDVFHENEFILPIIDKLTGANGQLTVDPGVVKINRLIEKLRPFYRTYKKIRKFATLGRK